MNLDDIERLVRIVAWTTGSVAAVVTTIKNMKDLHSDKTKKRRSKKKRRH